ncbi:MAG TPA: hypothetical protein VNW97_20195 [Candidatus Saccharimonadales bacterium]|nr:hypothetical protein [Candidatus Saccharimonadales bacterium]
MILPFLRLFGDKKMSFVLETERLKARPVGFRQGSIEAKPIQIRNLFAIYLFQETLAATTIGRRYFHTDGNDLSGFRNEARA